MSKATPERLLDSGPLVNAVDTSPGSMSKRTFVAAAAEESDEDSQHQQLKKLRMDDAEEETETANHSQETEKYSWDKEDDWLEDGYFDSVVKNSGSSTVNTVTKTDSTDRAIEKTSFNDRNSEEISTVSTVHNSQESELGETLPSAEKNATESESETASKTVDIGTKKAPPISGSAGKVAVGKCVVVDDCSSDKSKQINCECPGEGAVVCGPGDLPAPDTTHTHRDKQLPGKPNMKKLTSVMKDAEVIGELLNITDLNLLYEKVKQRRAMPNRVEVVTNEILEKGMDVIANEIKAQYQGATRNSVEDELMAEMEQIIDIVKAKKPACKVDPNDVYALLESNYKKPHRIQAVINILTGTIGSREIPMEIDDDDDDDDGRPPRTFLSPKPICSDPASIMNDVQIVLQRFPTVDPNLVYELLERFGSRSDRVSFVCTELARMAFAAGGGEDGECVIVKPDSTTPATEGEETSEAKNEDQGNESVDPLVKDTEFVSRMFPDKDKDEIYAYLEAHYNKPNRVDIVTEELLRINEHGDSMDGSQAGGEGPKPSESTPVTATTTENMSAVVGEDIGPLAQLEKDVETMRTVFPDCDPMYLYETLSARMDDPLRVEKLSSQLFENRNYPKLKDRLEKTKKVNMRNRLVNLKMDIAEFLQMFPDPVKHFYNTEKTVSEVYKQHAKIHLQNCFPMLHARYIQEKLGDHNDHLTPTIRDLEKDAQIYRRDGNRWRNMRKSRRFRKHARTVQEEMPDIPDEYFYHEVLFCRHEQEIKDHQKKQVEDKAERLRLAKEQKQLNKCGCCYDDEVLFEDVLACPEGHIFCIECIRRSSEELIGQAKIKFPCLAPGCEAEFPTATLRKVLSSKMLSNLLRKIQEEEIQQAGIEDLVSCPFCSFATIMPDPNDKVFKCMNPECLKESCRLCSEPNHIPLRCNEVEKKDETNMRTYIENKMTEAMIRICWKCKKRFYKTEGCNKMTCSSCGASMCYVCRKPIKDYGHFSGPNACPQDTDVFELHRQEMEKAAAEARKIYEKDHPDAEGKDLKYDPLKEMEAAYKQIRGGRGRGHRGVGALFGGIRHPHPMVHFAGIDHPYHAVGGLFGGGMRPQPPALRQPGPQLFGVPRPPAFHPGLYNPFGMPAAPYFAPLAVDEDEEDDDEDDEEEDDEEEEEEEEEEEVDDPYGVRVYADEYGDEEGDEDEEDAYPEER